MRLTQGHLTAMTAGSTPMTASSLTVWDTVTMAAKTSRRISLKQTEILHSTRRKCSGGLPKHPAQKTNQNSLWASLVTAACSFWASGQCSSAPSFSINARGWGCCRDLAPGSQVSPFKLGQIQKFVFWGESSSASLLRHFIQLPGRELPTLSSPVPSFSQLFNQSRCQLVADGFIPALVLICHSLFVFTLLLRLFPSLRVFYA